MRQPHVLRPPERDQIYAPKKDTVVPVSAATVSSNLSGAHVGSCQSQAPGAAAIVSSPDINI